MPSPFIDAEMSEFTQRTELDEQLDEALLYKNVKVGQPFDLNRLF